MGQLWRIIHCLDMRNIQVLDHNVPTKGGRMVMDFEEWWDENGDAYYDTLMHTQIGQFKHLIQSMARAVWEAARKQAAEDVMTIFKRLDEEWNERANQEK
jgi:hypothetical protein